MLVISGIVLMALSACAFGAICLGMGIKDSWKDKDWPGFFGMLAGFILLLLLCMLIVCAGIGFLESGFKGC